MRRGMPRESRMSGYRGHANPQLQILGNKPRRKNMWFLGLGGRHPRSVGEAAKMFHGRTNGDLVSEYDIDNGNDDKIDLAYLGHCPAISWLSDEEGSGRRSVLVDGEYVKFRGFRHRFTPGARPILALMVPDNEAVVVQGDVDVLLRQCDDDGVLGVAPIVEYVSCAVPGTTKGEDVHYVHEFERGREPVLRWDDSVHGFVYDKDRSSVSSSANDGMAVYEVTDWFHEGGIRRHGER